MNHKISGLLTIIFLSLFAVSYAANAGVDLTINGEDASIQPLELKTDKPITIGLSGKAELKQNKYDLSIVLTGCSLQASTAKESNFSESIQITADNLNSVNNYTFSFSGDDKERLAVVDLVTNTDTIVDGNQAPAGTTIYELVLFEQSESDEVVAFGINYEALSYTAPVQEETSAKELQSKPLKAMDSGGEQRSMMLLQDDPNLFLVWPDLNGDNAINNFDFAQFAANWQQMGTGLDGDYDRNGTVDYIDLMNIAYFWLETTNQSQFPYITSFETSQGFTEDMDVNDAPGWQVTDGNAVIIKTTFTQDSNTYSYNYAAVDSNSTVSRIFNVGDIANNSYMRISCIPTHNSYIKILNRSDIVAALRFGDPCDVNDTNVYIFDSTGYVDTQIDYNSAVQTARTNLAQGTSYDDCWLNFIFKFNWANSDYDVNCFGTVEDANFSEPFSIFTEVRFETGNDPNKFNINRISVSGEATSGGVIGDSNDVWITAPAADWASPLEGHVPLYGSVWYDSLSRYEIKCCPTDLDSSNSDNWMPVCSGFNVVKNGLLGYFDTYNFRNGDYFLKIEVYNDVNQVTSSGVITKTVTYHNASHTVNSQYPVSGIFKAPSFHYEEETADVSINWPGTFPFEFRRNYDHSLRRYLYPFFFGWTHNHNIRLMESTETDWVKNVNGTPAADSNGLGIGRLYLLMPVGGRPFKGQIESGQVVYRPLDKEQDYIIRTSSIQSGHFNVSYTHYSPDAVIMKFSASNNILPYTPSGGEGAVAWTVYTGIDRKEDRFGNALVYEWFNQDNTDLYLTQIESEIEAQLTGVKIILQHQLTSLNLCSAIQVQFGNEPAKTLRTFYLYTTPELWYCIYDPAINETGYQYDEDNKICRLELDHSPRPVSGQFAWGIDYSLKIQYNADETINRYGQVVEPIGPLAHAPDIEWYDWEKYKYENSATGELKTTIDSLVGVSDESTSDVKYKSKETLQNGKGLLLSQKIFTFNNSMFDPFDYQFNAMSPLYGNLWISSYAGGGGCINSDYVYGDPCFPSKPTIIYEHFDDDGNGIEDRPVRTTTLKYDERGNLVEECVFVDASQYLKTVYTYHSKYNFAVSKTTWQSLWTVGGTEPATGKIEQKWLYGDANGTVSNNGTSGDYLVREQVLLSQEANEWAETSYKYYNFGQIKTKIVQKTSDENDITYYEYDSRGLPSKEWQGVALNIDGTPKGNPTKRYYYDERGRLRLEGTWLGLVKMHVYNDVSEAGYRSQTRTYFDANAMFPAITFAPYRYDDPDISDDDYNYKSITKFGNHDIFGNAWTTILNTGGADIQAYFGNRLMGTLQYTNDTIELWPCDHMPRPDRTLFSARYGASSEGWYYGAPYDSNTLEVTMAYDSLTRLTNRYTAQIKNEGNPIVEKLKHEQSEYNALGQKSYEKIYNVKYNSGTQVFTPILEKNTFYDYDILGRMTTQIDDMQDTENPNGRNITTEFGYDAAGNRIYVIDPEGNIIFTDYDNANRKIREYFAAEPVFIWGLTIDWDATKENAVKKKDYIYYANGQIKDVNSYDNNGQTLLERSAYTYDSRGRIKTVTQQIDDSNDAITQYDYNDVGFTRNVSPADPCSYHIRITDAEQKQTWISLNFEGKPQKNVYPSDDYESMVYDGNGLMRQKSVWDNGQEKTIKYEYDKFGKITKITYPDMPAEGYLSFSYTPRFLGTYGKVRKITDHRNEADRPGDVNSIFAYEYDLVSGNISRYTEPNSYAIDYESNLAYPGQKKQIRVTMLDPQNPQNDEVVYDVNYAYDLAGRLTTVKDDLSGNAIASMQYDLNGNRVQLKYWLTGEVDDANTTIDYACDIQNNLIGIAALNPSGEPNYTFYADATGNIDGLGRLWDANEAITVPGQGNRSWTHSYGYNMRSELISAVMDRADTQTTDWSFGYQYLKDGNIETKDVNSQQTSYQYSGDLMTDAGNDELDWDENGRLIETPTSSFYYNWDGKLKDVNDSSGNPLVSLKYDPMGNRVCKWTYDANRPENTRYIVDIAGGLPTILCEINDSNGSITNKYYYANAQILKQEQHIPEANVPYFYIHDRLGSVRLVVNDIGDVNNSYTYSPFGETIDQQLSTNNSFRFTGQYYDSEINQYYLRARMYDPALMRFTARDTADCDEQEPLTLHRYLYCSNNSINRIDPLGESALQIAKALVDATTNYAAGLTVATIGADNLNFDLIIAGSMIQQLSGLVFAMSYATGGAAGNLDEIMTVSRWGRDGLQPGDWVMKGSRKNPLNYFLSGKWQPSWMPGNNQFAWPGSGKDYLVNPGDLKLPSGVTGFLKGLLCRQRIYNP